MEDVYAIILVKITIGKNLFGKIGKEKLKRNKYKNLKFFNFISNKVSTKKMEK